MDFIESKGKTVDEAVFSGLFKMDLSIDEVDIEILDEGGSLFKSAKVKLTKKIEPELKEEPKRFKEEVHFRSEPRYEKSFEPRKYQNEKPRKQQYEVNEAEVKEPENDAEAFLHGMFTKMNMRVALKSSVEDGILKIDMSGRNMGMLIGRRGETLDALQYLTSLVINNGKEDYTKVMIDTEDYRRKREDTLRRLAARLAEKVEKSRKRVVLEPMNPYERRILHSALQDYEDVYTYSEGEDPYRSVVVSLKSLKDREQEAKESSN